jgi:hypothetical protein
MKKFFFTLFIPLLFLGCTPKTPKSNTPPYWIDNPQDHPEITGKKHGVGYSEEHAKGKRDQRISAIAAAIEEIARQKGVVVNSVYESLKTSGGTHSSQLHSVQTTNGETVEARIIRSWTNHYTKEIYILMVEEE